jgi:hypothetical protein
VFGTGTNTSVNYTVADRGDGSPDITGVSSSDATAQVGATQYSSEDDEQEARATVLFTSSAQKRMLTIRVKVETEDDGSKRASLRISLGRTRGLPRPAAEVAGPHAWDGQLCDGTPAHIDYTIGLDGTVSGVSAVPAPLSLGGEEHTAVVRFLRWERVRITSVLEDGLITLNVSENFHCDRTPGTDAAIGDGASDDEGDDHDSGDGDHHGSSGVGGDHEGNDDHSGSGGDHHGDDHDDESDDDHDGSSGPRGTTGVGGGHEDGDHSGDEHD